MLPKGDERPLACCQANDLFGASKSSVLKRILRAGKMLREYVKRYGNYRKSARPRKQLFLDKKMDPVKKEVHILKGPIHLLAEDHVWVMGSLYRFFWRGKKKGEEMEIRTV